MALWNCHVIGQNMGKPQFFLRHKPQRTYVWVYHIPLDTSNLPWELTLTYVSLFQLVPLEPILMMGYYALVRMRILSLLRYHNSEKKKLIFPLSMENCGAS